MIDLFPDEFVEKMNASFGGPSVFPRPHVYYVATAPWNRDLREDLNQMISHLEPSDARCMVRRLRRAGSFTDTRSELEFADLLSACGHVPRYEMPIAGKTPDWSVVDGNGKPTLALEVATAHAPLANEQDNEWLTELALRLSRITQFHCDLVITHTSVGVYGGNHDSIAEHIADWLRSLDGGRESGSTILACGSGSLHIETLRRVHTCSGPIHIVMDHLCQWVDMGRLTDIVHKKLARYQHLDKAGVPFVLGIRCDADCMFGKRDLISVLFGDLALRVSCAGNRSESSVVRELDGLLSEFGPESWAALPTGFPSAVLWLDPGCKKSAWMVRNPWAKNDLPLPDLVPVDGSGWRVLELPVPEDVLARGA
ncbi:MAG: hypothetical protein ACYC5M_10605 [Anaerolineae bacterium]